MNDDLFGKLVLFFVFGVIIFSVILLFSNSIYEDMQPTCYVIENNIYEEGVVIDDVCLVRKGFTGSDTTRYINYSMKEEIE